MQLTSAKNGGKAGRSEAAIASSIIIARNPDEIYGFWRDFTRLPEIFDRLESVRALDSKRSHWKLALPVGRSLEWDAEITDDYPSRRIAWRSLSSSAPHSGEVRFERAAGQRGTKVSVSIRPEGVGSNLGKLFGIVPEQHVNIALHNLKQLLETGEIAKSDASIHRGTHPARPPEHYVGAGESVRAASV
jgi:uncharacterized membrane protein